MKLRNFVYAAMIACAFASCSKDDENVPTPDGGDANATLNVKIEAPTTRSGYVEDGNSAKINSLAVYVFDASSKTLQTVGASTNSTEALQIRVSAGNKDIVVLANTVAKKNGVALATGATWADFVAAEKDFSDEAENSFSMNSKVYTSQTIQAGVTNYLGFAGKTDGKTLATEPVKLYRNVAKINLQSITVAASANNTYPGAKLIVSDIFLLHGASMTKVVGATGAEWGSTAVESKYMGAASTDIYRGWADYMVGKKTIKNYIASANLADSYIGNIVPFQKRADWALTPSNTIDLGNTVGDPEATQEMTSLEYFYAFENLKTSNDDIHTLLVVKGKFVYGDLTENKTEERYYSVSVGKDGYNLVGGNQQLGDLTRSGYGVMRNLQYNINLTVKGPGYTTPFGPDGSGEDGGDTFLDVAVKVTPFANVKQVVDIE